MAFKTHLPMALFLSSLFMHAALADIVCEDLSVDLCAFSIASSGKRCFLETMQTTSGEFEYQCRTSEVVVERMAGHIESDKCVDACGLDRSSVGISSDALVELEFTAMLCSPACFTACPNIFDLYSNLAAGEGVFLSHLCQRHGSNAHQAMAELMSSGAANGPITAPGSLAAPGPLAGLFAPGPFPGLVAPGPIFGTPFALSPM